jgi:hypothetical protein
MTSTATQYLNGVFKVLFQISVQPPNLSKA